MGCWVEDPAAKEVAYPMVKDSWAMETHTADADTVNMGQYIQHTCNVGPRIPLPTGGAAPAMNFPAVATHPIPAVATHPSVEPTMGNHLRDSAVSEKGTLGSQSPSQPEVGGGPALWLKVLIIFGIAICLAAVAGGAYMAIVGRKKRTRGVAGGSKKAGSSRRSQRTEHAFESPSVGNMNGYSEPVAWRQGETVPFIQNEGGQGYQGQPQQQQQRSNYGNSFPQPQQGYMPTQPQMYQPMQHHGC